MTQIFPFPDPSGQAGPARPSDPVASPPDPSRATLSEAWSNGFDAAPAAFVLSALPRAGPILWVQDRTSAQEVGLPYAPALKRPLVHVRCGRAGDGLAAMEQGLGCPAVAAVIGEFWGDPPRLDFVATQRLALRAESAGMPCWLIRRGAAPSLSAARARWRVASLPSEPDPWDDRAPGAPRWRAELFRARGAPPSSWEARYDRAAHRLDLAAPSRDGAVARAAAEGARRAAR